MTSGRMAALDGLRGVLALLVMLGHLGLNTVLANLGLHINLEPVVDTFFVLSGFVMSRAYYFADRSFAELVASRIARLYPLHLFTLIWFCILLVCRGDTINGALLWQNLLLLHNVGLPPLDQHAFNFPSWSISVEFWVSIAFLGVVQIPGFRKWPALLTAGLLLAMIVGSTGLSEKANHLNVINSGMVRGVAGFCLGCAAYCLLRDRRSALLRLRWLTYPLVALLFGAMLLHRSGGSALAVAGAGFLAVPLMAATGSPRLLDARLFRWLGDISYSVYLIHVPVLVSAIAIFGAEVVKGVGAKVAITAFVLALAHANWRLVERPAQTYLLTGPLRVRREAAQ